MTELQIRQRVILNTIRLAITTVAADLRRNSFHPCIYLLNDIERKLLDIVDYEGVPDAAFVESITQLDNINHVVSLYRTAIRDVQRFIPTEYKVVAVSSNCNSFGLKSHVVLSRKGEGWSILANDLNEKKHGDIITVQGSNFSALGFECPTQLPHADEKAIKEVWGDN